MNEALYISQALRREIPGYSDSLSGKSFDELGLDSFALIELRASIENALGKAVDDRTWTSIRSPGDLVRVCANRMANMAVRGEFSRSRQCTINMPQMAVGGLSESWLFKEVGDFHWHMITEGLQTPSSQMVDGNGDRLYATFTRIKIEASAMADFRENDPLELTATLTRFGGGLFFGAVDGRSVGNHVTASTMSSFAKRSSYGSNKDLMRGQPEIPADCPIPSLVAKPSFAEEYSVERRADRSASSPIFEMDYQINPYHDINGVGLVYFAAYPLIADTCELEYRGGNAWVSKATTVARDICYFSNANADDLLSYQLLRSDETEDHVKSEALISNRTTGAPMALVRTTKALNG